MSSHKDPFVYWLIVVVALTVICRSTVRAEDDRSLANANEERIRQEFNKPTSFNFVETPLADVLAYFQQKHDIPMQFDMKALTDLGITTDRPVTKSLKNVTFRSALRYWLRDLDLTYVIRDEVLLITTPDEANKMLIRKVYDVHDLVPEGGYEKFVSDIERHVGPTTWDAVGGAGSISYFGSSGISALVVTQTDRVHEDLDALLSDLRHLRKPTKDK